MQVVKTMELTLRMNGTLAFQNFRAHHLHLILSEPVCSETWEIHFISTSSWRPGFLFCQHGTESSSRQLCCVQPNRRNLTTPKNHHWTFWQTKCNVIQRESRSWSPLYKNQWWQGSKMNSAVPVSSMKIAYWHIGILVLQMKNAQIKRFPYTLWLPGPIFRFLLSSNDQGG